MKYVILSLLLCDSCFGQQLTNSVAINPLGATFTAVTNGPQTNPATIQGHNVSVSFQWEVVTNRFMHNMSIGWTESNSSARWQPYDEWYAVDSNYVAILIVDGKTNRIIQDGVGTQLGEVHRKIQPYMATEVISEKFEPKEGK